MKPSLVLVALLSVAAPGCSAPAPSFTGAVSSRPFHSEIVDDDYVLRVRLPPGYEASGARYPLVVQLDPTAFGLHQLAVSSSLVSEHAARGEWEEAIVLGVDYPELHDMRERDYAPPSPPRADFGGGGADLFYQVLRDEILPLVEGELRVDPARRTIMGHSNGALFACYTALRSRPGEPPLFSTVVSADGGYDGPVLQYQAWHQAAMHELPVSWLITRAVYNGAVQKVGYDALTGRLAAAGYAGMQLDKVELETDHAGAVRPSYERGLALALSLGGVR